MLLTVKLNSSHKKDLFACEEPSLETYLKTQAGQDIRKRVAACFVLEGSGGTVKGYYTLSSDSVDRSLLPADLQRKLHYKRLPVTLLGRLARDVNFKGQGIGELLIADALKRACSATSTVASWAVVTDPLNDGAVSFYKSFGFMSLESGRMFIPMKTVGDSIV